MSAAPSAGSPRIAGRALVALVLALPLSCAALEEAGRVLLPKDTPDAQIVGVNLRDLDFGSVTLGLDVEVSNPYAVPLPIGALGYELTSGGRSLARGSTADGASLPARSRRVVPITVQLAFSDVLATLSDIRPGALVPWEAAIDVSVEAPVLGTLHLPLQTKGELPVPAVPEVSLASMRWNELTFETARATLSLDVLNTNAFPIDLRELSFGLALAGRDVADARVTSAGSTAAGDTARLSVPVSFSPLQLGLSAMNLLGGAAAAYTLDGTLDLGTPFGTLGTPFLRAGQVPFLR